MKIGIDYRLASTSNRGMGRYAREIVNSLIKLDKENEYILYSYDEKDIENIPRNFSVKKIKKSNYILEEQISLPMVAKRDKIDILWCPANTFPLILSNKIKLFVTIHDVIFMEKRKMKEMYFHQFIGKVYRKYCLKFGQKKINVSMTVSEYSKCEIKKYFKKLNPYITNNNVDNLVKKLRTYIPNNEILNKLNLNKNEYFYSVTGISPNKNLSTLIDIFASDKVKEKIVITGVNDYKNTDMYKFILENNLEEKIIFTERITDEQMIELYNNTKGFVFLSINEGFGIPLVEAMLFDIPIISSNASCLPEIVGDAAILVDPFNKNKILDILQHIESLEINKNDRIRQLKKYTSWDNTTRDLIEIFKKN